MRTMRRKGSARIAVVIGLCGWPMLLSLPARADVTGPCDGSVTIDGVRYTPVNDTPGNPVVIPEGGGVIVDWRGTTATAIHNYTGAVSVRIGPVPITVARWSGENAKDETEKQGQYNLDNAYDELPFDVVGVYRVSGFHHGDEGACDGFVYVKIEGNPLATVPGAAAAALTVGTGALTLAAGKARRIRR